jgi:LuxR family maltose regulon positive regulatory protein
LVARLEEGRGRPLTLVCAPAGYGKSTLLSHWLASSEVASAWLSLDGRDDDLRTFLSYVTAALDKAFPGACPRTAALVDAPELPPVPILVTELTNEWDGLAPRVTLVLDDFHWIRDQAVHDLLGAILAHPPRGVHLAITSRRDPPLPLAVLRAKGAMAEVREKDLRFTDEESGVFLGKVLDFALDPTAAAQLVRRAEGWVAGLRLVALSVQNEQEVRHLLGGIHSTNTYVMDYLVSEVVAHQNAEIQRYLLTTSVLDRFCAPLCDVAVGEDQATRAASGDEFVRWLLDANVFVVPLADEHREWYRYHHLFRQLLQHQLENRMDADGIARVHERVSDWFDHNGYYEDAVHHALAAGDPAAAARVVARRRNALMNREQWDVLHRLFARLPADLVTTDPALLIQAAWNAENRVRIEEMVERLGQAETLLGGEQDSTNAALEGEVAALGAARSYYRADARGARDLAQRAVDALPADALSTRGFAAGVLSLAYQMDGDFAKATTRLTRELQDEARHDTTYHARLLICLALCQWCEGDLPGVLRTARRLRVLGDDFDLAQTRFFADYFRGISHYHRNELDSAEQALSAVVEGSYAVDRNNFAHSAFALALTHLAQGRDLDAERVTEAVVARAMESHNALLVRHAHAFMAELALRLGRATEAEQWAVAFDPDPILPGLRFYVPQLTLAKVLAARDTPASRERAVAVLERLEDYFGTTHNTRVLTDVLALRSLLEAKQGNREPARQKLECAIVAGARGGIVRPFLDLGMEFMELVGRLELGDDVAQYVGRIVAAYHDERLGVVGAPVDPAVLRTPPSGSQPLIEPLSNRELDVLGLLARRLSNKEIAGELHITPATVKRHTVSIYQKLSVHGRRDAVAKATRFSPPTSLFSRPPGLHPFHTLLGQDTRSGGLHILAVPP